MEFAEPIVQIIGEGASATARATCAGGGAHQQIVRSIVLEVAKCKRIGRAICRGYDPIDIVADALRFECVHREGGRDSEKVGNTIVIDIALDE